MYINVEDWHNFTWFHFAWREVSHPAICIRFRLFSYVLGLTYLRIRPKAYLATYPQGVTDSRVVFDLPRFYKDPHIYERGI